MAKIEEQVLELIKEPIDQLKLDIYDIEYAKEGTDWYLRIYIDKIGGVDISDCETVSRLIEPIIDEKDLIKSAYYLEVSSPGVERVLRKQEHFDKNIGSMIELSFFKAVEGTKKMEGILKSANDEHIVIEVKGETKEFLRVDIGKVKTVYNFNK